MTESTSPANELTERPVPRTRKWTTARTIGYVAMGMWVAAGFGIIVFLVNSYSFVFFEKYAPKFFYGLIVTLKLVAISLVIGAFISLPIAGMRMSASRILRSISFGYVQFFRGTPLIAQTFLVYYGAGEFRPFFQDIGLWWFFRDAWYCAIFAFSLNTAAYQAEILRGSIENLPKGQWEACSSLGLPGYVAFFRIILPQAMIVALRPYGNEIILMIKGSAIVSVITVFDLFGEAKRAYSRTFDFQTYIWAAIIYLSMVETLRRVWDRLEKRLTRHLVRTGS